MNKSLYSRENIVLCSLLRKLRKESGHTQADVAKQMQWPQSYVSRYESGERRVDPVELYYICDAIGISFPEFAARYEKALADKNFLQHTHYS